MWAQISCLYCSLIFGVYCFTLPSASDAMFTIRVSNRLVLDQTPSYSASDLAPNCLQRSSVLEVLTRLLGKNNVPAIVKCTNLRQCKKARKMKFISSNDLRILASEISNNKDFGNKEFKALVKPMLIPRMPDTEGSRLVQEYIKDHLQKLNWVIEEDQFEDNTPYGRKTFTNIVATFEPQVKNKLVLACHFDSKNISDSAGRYFIGATDSAVPCAIMLDIAKKLDCALRQKRDTRKRSVAEDSTLQLMFFDGEEAYKSWTSTDSLYGSRHLARKLRVTEDSFYLHTSKLDNIELFVLLDLIGTKDITFQSFFPKTEGFFTWLAKTEKTCVAKGFLNPNGLMKKRALFSSYQPWHGVEDDHKPFLRERKDLPVLHLISAPFPTVWHTMEDDAAHIDYDVTDNVNRLVRVFVAAYLGLPATTCRH